MPVTGVERGKPVVAAVASLAPPLAAARCALRVTFFFSFSFFLRFFAFLAAFFLAFFAAFRSAGVWDVAAPPRLSFGATVSLFVVVAPADGSFF